MVLMNVVVFYILLRHWNSNSLESQQNSTSKATKRVLLNRHLGTQVHQVSRSRIYRLGKDSQRRRPLSESRAFSSADAKSGTARNRLAGGQSSQGGD